LFVSGHEGVAGTSRDKLKLRVEIIGVFRLLNRVPFCTVALIIDQLIYYLAIVVKKTFRSRWICCMGSFLASSLTPLMMIIFIVT